jgi:hypothetical protein
VTDVQEELPLEEVAEAEASPAEEGGVAEVEAQPEDAEPAPEVQYLDYDQDSDNNVTVKVNGEDQTVPLREALDGYSRTQDYTAKTQAAAEAIRLQEALDSDPGLTVQILAKQAGVSVEKYLGLNQQEQQPAAEPQPEYEDPLEQALHDERQQRVALQERFESREADEALGRAVNGLKQQFGANDDQARAVVRQALDMGLGVEAFPMIYQSMSYQAQQQATAANTATQAATTASKQAAAQAATAVVSSGTGATGTVESQPAEKFNSIRDAANAAFDELEGNRR